MLRAEDLPEEPGVLAGRSERTMPIAPSAAGVAVATMVSVVVKVGIGQRVRWWRGMSWPPTLPLPPS